MQNMWSAWIAERSWNPLRCRNRLRGLTRRSTTRRNEYVSADPKNLQHRAHGDQGETQEGRETRAGFARITIHEPRLLNSKQPKNAHHIRRGDIIERPFVFLFKLLPQIPGSDVTRFAVRDVAAGSGIKL